MRKLIETKHKSLVVCDNPQCDYEVPYSKMGDQILALFIDKPCPKCEENLLTMDDFIQYRNFMRVVNFMNKWFSWITIFYSKRAKEKSILVHVHKGVKISYGGSS